MQPLTALDYYPADALLTELLSYTQTSGSAGFNGCPDTISASYEKNPLFIKRDSIFPFYHKLKYTSETITGTSLNSHYVSS
jgi:hypothetical protein